MKTLIISALCFAFSLSLGAQSINKPVIIKRTASWCVYCGTWGWSFMKDVQENIDENEAIILAMHFSGDMENDLNSDIASNLGGSGQPRFYLNNEDQFVSSGNASSRLTELTQKVAQINASTPDFDLVMNAHKEMDQKAITASVSLMPRITDFEKDYYIAIYLVEDGVLNSQSGQSGLVEHPKVLRASFSGNSFGELAIPKGSSWSGDPLKFDYTLEDSEYIPSDYLDKKYDVVAMVFSKDGSKYTIEQAEHVTDISFLSSNQDLAFENTYSIYQNQSNQLILEGAFDFEGNATLNIFSFDGRLLLNESLSSDKIFGNTHHVDIRSIQQGNYIVSMNSNKGVWSQQFLVVR